MAEPRFGLCISIAVAETGPSIARGAAAREGTAGRNGSVRGLAAGRLSP
jgi:hypothetical protein